MSAKYEYRVIGMAYDRSNLNTKPHEQSLLNSMGKEGWELAAITELSMGDRFYFKRLVGDWPEEEAPSAGGLGGSYHQA